MLSSWVTVCTVLCCGVPCCSCITYLRLETNQGRTLTLGDVNSNGPLQISQPDWKDGFLAFFKGYTDVPNTSASTGRLQLLQLVWTSKKCGRSGSSSSSSNGGQPEGDDKQKGISDRDAAVKRMKASEPALPAAAEVDTADAADAAAVGGVQGDQTVVFMTDSTDTSADTSGPAGVTQATVLPVQQSDATAVSAQVDQQAITVQATELDTQPNEQVVFIQPAAGVSEPEPEPVSVQTAAAAQVSQPNASAAAYTQAAAPTKAKKHIFIGPLRKPDPNAATSTTVVNTTTIITTTTTETKPTDGADVSTTSTTTTTLSSTTAVCLPNSNCADGVCSSSSCALNGMGKDVPALMCFGTNIVPNPILEKLIDSPCTNLACKLDKPGCSTGDPGKNGFCTGKVVTMGNTAKVHELGKLFLGYPCVGECMMLAAVASL